MMFKIRHGDGTMSDARRTARHRAMRSRSIRMSRTWPPNPTAADAIAERTVSVLRLKRARCESVGHPLGEKDHEADRWIESTAVALDVDLVSEDGVFQGVDG